MLFVAAGVLWVRSFRHMDLYANLEPAADHQGVLKGLGSYRGALLIGSLQDPQPCECETGYEHSVFQLAPKGSGHSLLQVVPAEKHSALGFGASKGELKFNVPILSLFTPGRKYEVVYVPYYFFMLLGVLMPARKIYRVAKKTTSPPPNPSEA